MAGKVYNIAEPNPSEDLLSRVEGQYSTILADPPWQFQNRTGKMAEENSHHGVARRKGHEQPQLRLLQAPAGYRVK